MVDPSVYLENFGPWLLVFNRVLGLFIFTPLLASASVPVRFRALLAAGVAAAMFGFVPPEFREMPDGTIAEHAVMMGGEFMIGAVIGFLAGMPLIAMEMAGHLMGHQMALSLAEVFNPELGSNMNAIGSLLFYMGITSFVMMSGPEITFMILAGTFERMPIGGFMSVGPPLDVLVGVLSAGTEIAVRVAAPTLAMVLVILVGMGFIMRTMPQVNVLSVGFAVKIVGGLLMLLFSLFTINTVMAGHVDETLLEIERWVAGIVPPSGQPIGQPAGVPAGGP